MSASPRFLCDEMLGKLARELRALGYDAAYAHGSDDDAIRRRAEREDRLLVTRDRQLADRAGSRALLLETRDPGEQLTRVIEREGLQPSVEAFLTRCLECNEPIVEAEAGEEVPDEHADDPHWRCPSCGRTYWAGTHARDMLDRLGEHLPGEPELPSAVGPPGEADGERKP